MPIDNINLIKNIINNTQKILDDIKKENQIKEYYDGILYDLCYIGHYEIIKFLIEEKNIKINKIYKNSETILFILCKNNHLDVLKYIIEKKN